MKIFCTTIHALDPIDGEYKEFCGPNIKAPSQSLAFEYCQNNGLGYCHIGGEIVMEIPCDKDFKPDWNKSIDYENIQLN